MTNLITDAQFDEWAGFDVGDVGESSPRSWAVSAASSHVRLWCGRSFEVDTSQTPTARYFTPLSDLSCFIDDAQNITAVATDDADNGTWSTAWSTSDWYATPTGGIGPNGLAGWPYTAIVAVESRWFPRALRPSVKVTAEWGWLALPDDVFLATCMVANELLRAKSGGFDILTADGTMSPIRRNAVVRDLLAPYRTARAQDARFVLG